MDKLIVTGIDIGHNSLKAVVLKPIGDQYALLGYKEILLKEGIVAENNTINHQEIVKTLKQMKKELPFGAKRVAISVPDNSVISKKLQIEQSLDESEIEFAVVQAFSHQSPFPVEELSLDFVRLRAEEGMRGTDSYQVFATRKDVVESRVDALQQSGLKPVLVDVHSQSLGHIWKLAAERFPEKNKYCLLDIGSLASSFTMFTEQGELFHKEFACGTRISMGTSQEDLLSDDAQAKTEQFNRQVVERVKRQMQLYTSINGSQNIKGIWLSGEGASTPMLAEELSHQLALECELLNPLGLFEMKVSKRKRRAADWQHFSTAAGLAVRGIHWLGGVRAVSH
ncbi:type IV pilus biogenesis protein PilM [Vibrio parahaemolyticus]|uniref:type IV pilus biogenesis protein PilM n=1 Tax=Vibrio parahaemolyticus TaxID=670 RepID=UPI00084B5299|nr:type IV pilus assembly protein PilM [Vibrio parahaemolyticus]MDS1911182.1 type IV pilus assembly protein PilM [Vibrio parahaemolyticus]ODX16853.1 pilus assembly protein PilM [Vibrio parahaemolyticus]